MHYTTHQRNKVHESQATVTLNLNVIHLPTLQDEGTFNDKLAEMYDWGRMHGWDPVVLVNGRPSPAGSTAQQ